MKDFDSQMWDGAEISTEGWERPATGDRGPALYAQEAAVKSQAWPAQKLSIQIES